MARVTVEDCLANVRDQFALVHLAAQRYRQLHRGAPRLVDNKNKDIVCALREIASGSVRFREDVDDVMISGKNKVVSQRLQQLIDSGYADTPADSQTADNNTAVVDDGDTPTPLI